MASNQKQSLQFGEDLKKIFDDLVKNFNLEAKSNNAKQSSRQKRHIQFLQYVPSKYGNFFSKDIPKKIIKPIMKFNNLFFRLQWQQRRNGFQPLDSEIPLDKLQKHYPALLLNYFQENLFVSQYSKIENKIVCKKVKLELDTMILEENNQKDAEKLENSQIIENKESSSQTIKENKDKQSQEESEMSLNIIVEKSMSDSDEKQQNNLNISETTKDQILDVNCLADKSETEGSNQLAKNKKKQEDDNSKLENNKQKCSVKHSKTLQIEIWEQKLKELQYKLKKYKK